MMAIPEGDDDGGTVIPMTTAYVPPDDATDDSAADQVRDAFFASIRADRQRAAWLKRADDLKADARSLFAHRPEPAGWRDAASRRMTGDTGSHVRLSPWSLLSRLVVDDKGLLVVAGEYRCSPKFVLEAVADAVALYRVMADAERVAAR
jgi:hypothetical protein